MGTTSRTSWRRGEVPVGLSPGTAEIKVLKEPDTGQVPDMEKHIQLGHRRCHLLKLGNFGFSRRWRD